MKKGNLLETLPLNGLKIACYLFISALISIISIIIISIQITRVVQKHFQGIMHPVPSSLFLPPYKNAERYSTSAQNISQIFVMCHLALNFCCVP